MSRQGRGWREDRALVEEGAVVLCALPVVAAADIRGRRMSGAIPTPAAWCCRIGVDRRCQLVMTAVADVAKAIEMAVLRLDESEPGVPERVSPVQGLKEFFCTGLKGRCTPPEAAGVPGSVF